MRLTSGNMDEIALRLRGEPGGDAAVRRRVEEIIAVVRDRGDEALVSLTRELDAPDFSRDRLRVAPGEAEAALESAPEALVDSLRLAADNIRLFHQHELRGDWTAPMRQNQMLGQRMIPVGRAGLYVPGGGADYPSSVLMTVIPAQVAGVGEICICTPPDREGRVSQPVLAAAAMMEVGEIYRCGGAQAIAAMAYGTGSIRPVDVVAGPGNVYVTEAKRQVFGRVGIDGLAGPSEVLVIAGGDAAADLIAADLLAQTEHGSGAIAVLVSWSPELLERVEEEAGLLQRELGMDERLLDRITLVLVEGDDPQSLAMAFSNRFAPEHLQIHTEQPEQDAHDVSAAGAVFLGEDVCTAYGDYIIGSNHVLPTAGSARYGSALSVENFLRKVAVISLIPATVSELTPSLVEIARAEGLRAHARAAELRLERFGQAEEEDEE